MSTLRLVNPQPMETLPVAGDRSCFVEYDNGGVRMIQRRELIDELREYEAAKRGERVMSKPTSWSYTATFGDSTEMIPKPLVKVVWDESTQLYDVTVNGVIADDGLYRVDAMSSAHYHAEILGLSPDDVIVEDTATFEPLNKETNDE